MEDDDEIPPPPLSKFEIIITLVDKCREDELLLIHDILSSHLHNDEVSELNVEISPLCLDLLKQLGIQVINNVMLSTSASRKDVQEILSAINGRLNFPHCWEKVVCDERNSPPKRSIHASCVVDEKYVVIHGGICESGGTLLYKFDLETKTWDILKAQRGRGLKTPKLRWSHSMVVLKNKLFLFGGVDPEYFFSELLTFDLDNNTWNSMEVRGIPPKHGTSLCVYKDRYLVDFGGAVNGRGGYSYVKSLHILDCENGEVKSGSTWEKKSLVFEENIPDTLYPRGWHSAKIIDENKMVVFGGCNSHAIFNDVHIINLSTFVVKKIENFGTPPPRKTGLRRQGYRIFDGSGKMVIRNNFLFVYGGFSNRDNNPASNLFRLDLKTKNWEIIPCKNRPSHRMHFSLDLAEDKLVLFGGSNVSRMNETWIMTLKFNRGNDFKKQLMAMTVEKTFSDLLITVF